MAVTHEVVWDYDMVEPGQAAQPITTEVTPESISRHAEVCRNDNPRYHLPLLETGSLAMPSQIFGIAPKNRGGIAENNGMSVIQAHATPFAKAEGRLDHECHPCPGEVRATGQQVRDRPP